MDLRPYQASAIDQIRTHFKDGKKKVLLHLATGGGKTHCFSYMMMASSQKGVPCIMVVRGRKLVDQASKRLFHEGVHHGVMMARHWNEKHGALIQICSIDTMIQRGLRPFKNKKPLIVIDEAHMATSPGYKEFLSDYPDAYIVAVTATPYVYPKSLSHIAEVTVCPISIKDLIHEGYLVPPRYFAPTNPDVSQVRVSSTGDYVTQQLAQVMDQSSITGDILSHWKRIAENRLTLCFAVSVEHSKHIAKQFTEGGVPAEHCDADTPEEERDRIIKKLESGEIKVITNVGIYCTGVDIPSVSCIIMARPTKSSALYRQQAGRGTRIFPGKKDFILLDHAGNVTRHGFITDEPVPNLDGKEPNESRGPKPRVCASCFAIVEGFPCPAQVYAENGWQACGWQPEADSRGARSLLQVEGDLQEIKPPSDIERYECDRFCEKEIDKCLERKQNVWKAYYKTAEQFGHEAARMSFFRICKRNGIPIERKKKEKADGFPFK